MEKKENFIFSLIIIVISLISGAFLFGYGSTYNIPGYVVLGTDEVILDPGQEAWTEVQVGSSNSSTTFDETTSVDASSTTIMWQNRETTNNYDNATLNNGTEVLLWSNTTTNVVSVEMVVSWQNSDLEWFNLSTPTENLNITLNGSALQKVIQINETGNYEILDSSHFPIPVISDYTIYYNQFQSLSYSYTIEHDEVSPTFVEAKPTEHVNSMKKEHYGDDRHEYSDGLYVNGTYVPEEEYQNLTSAYNNTFTYNNVTYEWPAAEGSEYRVYDEPKRNYIYTIWWDQPESDWSNSIWGRGVIVSTVILCTIIACLAWWKLPFGNKKEKAIKLISIIGSATAAILIIILIPLLL